MSKAKYDAMMVLGASLNLDGSLVETDTARLDKVVSMYKEGSTGAVIVCGSRGYKAVEESTLTEARAYADYLEQQGVPGGAIYLEEESQESLGNVLFTKMYILAQHDWTNLLVLPTYNHATERIEYILKKVLGSEYEWDILRVGENKDAANMEREAKSLNLTKDINDQYSDGDHESIYEGLMATHPAYGGTKWTMDELREELKH